MLRQLAVAFAVAFISAPLLQAATPQLSVILPRGIQRGAESELTFRGSRLTDVEEVMLYDEGIEVLSVDPDEKGRVVKVRVRAAEDCKLGEQRVRLRAKTGLSDVATFVVGPYPSVDEKEPNNDFEAPQQIDRNITIHGVANREDVDYFVIDAAEGERISVEVEGVRLGSRNFFDPYVAILDEDRFELVVADDTPLVRQDAVASVIAPKDGRYIIEMRESTYRGRGDSYYRLHVGTFPRPTAVYPPGGPRGGSIDLRFIGDPSGAIERNVTLPSEGDWTELEIADDTGVAPSPHRFRLADEQNILEQEPNDDRKQATPGVLPCAFNGIIEKYGDVDHFKFSAKKGQRFDLQCYARRLRSPLDPVVNVYRLENGQGIKGNDDQRGQLDSGFDFRVPEDGEYVIRVRDHLGRGGKNFVYRIEFVGGEKSISFGFPQYSRYGQERHYMTIPRGGRLANIFNARRSGIGDGVAFNFEGLPEGVTAVELPLSKGSNSTPILFTAAEDAPLGGTLVNVRPKLAESGEEVAGGFSQGATMTRGPGNSSMWNISTDRLAVAVVESLPYSIEVKPPTAPLIRNGRVNLPVTIHREEGFEKDVTLEFRYRPPGVSARSNLKVKKDQSEANYQLSANGKAALGTHQVFVFALADDGGPTMTSSQLFEIQIEDPPVTVNPQQVAAEQGSELLVPLKAVWAEGASDSVLVRLKGLPHRVTADELTLTPGITEAAFTLQIDAESPTGVHKGLFCEVEQTFGEETVQYRGGGTHLRIDKPRKPKPEKKPKAESPPKEEAAPKKEPPKKPLSRLELLRQQAEENRTQD
ncbi:peptidase [Stratiformator vulcanicus]|uniref:Subtilase-type serine protease n=1 Tax=Stratiformator vulcanicus TaxID=2527980 RepID=A0A517QW27_9PLAN|nr:peptidase [Stratiformator vulcanicus]QDT35778.1 hypothetical protein Pan189_01310 [Stratiformator vulcanicus]